ncbi:conserved domain protein [delta proteobacterium NaphS2]|nr:conserved domain protein [delta proteobacterium NaphS2]
MKKRIFKVRFILRLRDILSVLPIVGLICFIIPASIFAADRLVVKDNGGMDVFKVEDDGAITSDGSSFPVSKIRRTTSYTTGGRGVAAFELMSSGNMKDGFGPSFEFWISDNAHTATKGIVTLEAVRDGGDQNGKLEILTSNAGNLKYRMAIDSVGYVGIGQRYPAYPLQMGSGAYVSSGGVWTNASSRAYKQDIKSLTREEAEEALTALQPVQFSYKTNPKERHVGFIAEDVPDLVASTDRKGMSAMDVVAVLTKVVQDQQKTIAELSKKVAALEKK